MNEMQRIIQAVARLRECGQRAALATVVAVEGSTYRRPGARMLVSEDGEAEGGISGGCLERDVFRQAARVLHSGEPAVTVYDSTGEDLDEGYSLGCNGVVVVLVEPLAPAGPAGALDFVADCLQRRRKGVVATVFAVRGAVPTRVGGRLTLADDGEICATGIDDESTRELLRAEATKALHMGRSSHIRICTPAGEFDAFVEV
ncbi:MAG: XdhC family protein, partial [Candidatus Didemnitutus sp.]|nr:XdhC family protein [Candidatus Didemnitutus sp.]